MTFNQFFCILYYIRKYEKIKKEDMLMKYTKPTVITAEKVNAAKCGDGPCGRPCSINRA